MRRCLPLCDKKSLYWVRHRCGHFPIRTFWLTNNSMKFFLQAEKNICLYIFYNRLSVRRNGFCDISYKNFFAFSVDVGSTEKNGSQRQKLTRKICTITKSLPILNWSRLYFYALIFRLFRWLPFCLPPIKTRKKIFSVLVFWLPKRQNKTNSGEI